MRHNATPETDTPTPGQERALAALLAGKSVTDAAAVAAVDRTTVHRWLKDDFAFQAAFNRGRRELGDALRAKLLALADRAAECVGRAIDADDPKTALALLRGLGLLGGDAARVGSDDPRDLAIEAAGRRQHREMLAMINGAG